MSDFTWPSDVARAENDELARVCNYLEDVLDERDALAVHIEKLHNFIRSAPVSTGVCCCGDDMERHAHPMSCGHSPVDEWDHQSQLILDEAPDTIALAKRDLIKQAEALEDVAQANSRELIHPQIVMNIAAELRQQAEGLSHD